ncbi:hypothetical protein ACX80D_04560 [Arthrobacter sp. Sr24]
MKSHSKLWNTVNIFVRGLAPAMPLALLTACSSTNSTSSTNVLHTPGTVLGTVLANGAQQVTLNGLPLYAYAADKNPGDDSGQGKGGIW